MEQDLSPRPYRFQENNQYPSSQDFDDIVQNYLDKLSFKKRDKALIDRQRYELILQVLQEPKNTSVSTAQFRFWVKKMFQLVPLHNGRLVVCHDNKPVAMREQIYHILIWAHRQSHHGGRDKTSTLVRRRFSWIPKELIARFVRHCPFCITRRNGHADMFSTYANMQNHYQRQQIHSEESRFMNSISHRSSNAMYQSQLSSPPTDPIPCCLPNMPPAPNHNSGTTTNALGPPPISSSAANALSDDMLCPLPSSSSSSTHSAALTATSSSSTSTTATASSPSSGDLPPPPLYTDHHHPQCCFPPPPSLSQPSPEEIFIKDTSSSLTDHFTPTTTATAPTDNNNNSNSCIYAHQQQRNQQQVRMDGYGFMHVHTMDPTPTSHHRHQEQQSMLASPTSPLSPTACHFEPKRPQPIPPFVNQQSLNLMSFF